MMRLDAFNQLQLLFIIWLYDWNIQLFYSYMRFCIQSIHNLYIHTFLPFVKWIQAE